MNLYVDEDLGHLLSPLHSLHSLKELKLLACNFYRLLHHTIPIHT